MSFTSESKAKQSSYRTALVRLTGQRAVSDLLSSQGGGVYGLTFNYVIASVVYKGSELTKVTGTPAINQYSIDESTGAFLVYPNIGMDSITTYQVYIKYYLFFSSDTGVSTYQTPNDSATPVRFWHPRLIEEPSISANIQNIFQGVFEISQTNISINNTDRYMQQFFTAYDSFNQQTCDIWFFIDAIDSADVQQVYAGRVTSVNFSDDRVNFSAYDAFSRLDQPAYMGDKATDCILGIDSAFLRSQDVGKAIPYLHGARTPYDHAIWAVDSPNTDKQLFNGLRAICVDYSPTISTTTNRQWILCRTDSGGIKQLSHSAVTSSLNPADSMYDFNSFYNFSTHNFEIGDSVAHTLNGVTYYAHVVYDGSDGTFTWLGNNYKIALKHVNSSTPTIYTMDSTLTAPGSYGGNPAITLKRGNETYTLVAGYDFDYSVLTNDSGNLLHTILLKDNFEGNDRISKTETTITIGDPIDPNSDEIIFSLSRATTNNNHAEVVKSLCDASGMTTNASSFTTAASDLDIDTHFMIPEIGSDEFQSYRYYVENIVSAVPGYLYLNSSNEVAYKVLSSLSSTETVTSDLIIKGSLQIKHDYQDILTEIVSNNKHVLDSDELNATPTAAITLADTEAAELYNVQKSLTLNHFLKTISGHLQNILDFRSLPTTIYKFKTATKHLDIIIGTDITIESDQVLDGSGSVVAKVIGFEKTLNDVTIEAIVI